MLQNTERKIMAVAPTALDLAMHSDPTRTSDMFERRGPPNRPEIAHFLPDIPVRVKVTDSGIPLGTKRVWYTIKVDHGEFSWTMVKKLTNLVQLELRLDAFRAWMDFPLASHTEARNDIHGFVNEKPNDTISSLPFLMTSRELERRDFIKDVIEKYLNYIAAVRAYRNHPSTLRFFELSGFSLIKDLGRKGKEGFLLKVSPCFYFGNAKKIRRWFVLKDSHLMYLDTNLESIQGVLLFDAKAVVEHAHDDDSMLEITNSSFTIKVQCPNVHLGRVWASHIEENILRTKLEFQDQNPSGSYVPTRLSPAHWFVDGKSHFSAVEDALENAKEEIYITGWFLSPFVYLKRKPKLEEKNLLKSILKKKADSGVKIYIIIYDEPDGIIDLGGNIAKETLENINPQNIKVLQHRGQLFEGSIFWSHHEKLVVVDQNVAFVSGIDLTYGRWDFEHHPLTDIGDDPPASSSEGVDPDVPIPGQLWRGVDYLNDYRSDIEAFEEPFKDHHDRRKVPRMPWHDVGAVTYHQAARDVARHFIQRWNYIKATELRDEQSIPFLIPKAGPTEEEKSLVKVHPDAVYAEVQVLRSAALWSVGIRETESSIHAAQLQAIENSEHFIYIENQFFISIRKCERVHNEIVDALYRRIVRAKVEKKKFRLYVVMPLVPGLVGDFSKDAKSQQIQVVAQLQYQSISRGKGSLIESLRDVMPQSEINEYVSFCSLRTHGELGGKAITAVLYVHSKMMIVDDRIAFIGSANVNDRSLLGDRDSEVSLRVEDTQMIDSVMDGGLYRVGKFVSRLRKRSFAEHLDLLPDNYNDEADFPGSERLSDVVSDDFYYKNWTHTAIHNTEIYEEVFKPVPSDSVRRFSEVEDHQNQQLTEEKEKRARLRNIKGSLVLFPKRYLEDEDLDPEFWSLLRLAPVAVFS